MHSRIDIDLEEDGYLTGFIRDWENRIPWWKRKIYYPIYRFVKDHLNPIDYVYDMKYAIQRGKRGYSDRDCWNLGYYTAKLMKDSIVTSLPMQYGYPAEFDWPDDEGWDYWQAIQATIAYGLDHYIAGMDLEETCTCCGKYCMDTQCPIVADAFDLLIGYWSSLGD